MAASVTGPLYPALFNEDGTSVSSRAYDDAFKFDLLLTKWDDASSFKFPTRYAQGRFRTLQPKYFVEHGEWLRYSTSSDGVYCARYHLFAGPDSRAKSLVGSVYRDWSNISNVVASHAKSETHLSNSDAADNFLSIMNGKERDILSQMSSNYNVLLEKNGRIVISITEAIFVCAKQNIAFRGHENDEGNFRALIEYQAKHDTILQDHLANGDPQTMYLSGEIQKELIGLCGKQIADNIVDSCNKARFFGFIRTRLLMLARWSRWLCVRYFDGMDLREEFIGFAECSSTTGENLANSFLQNLENAGVHIDNMRDQGYDGAANMSGISRGVQA